ncbi:MAG: nitrate reductase subunit beta [Bryobacterales bacterium]|nr:nitrate reductase subunit beta [Bryobacterales bacterium]
MNVRSQISMVFHLDKCIGCHTCSVACKNVWTDRKGAEYMWWNNVETKPGTGYPTLWEDQEEYQGGWEVSDGKLQLKSTSKKKIVFNIFHNPHMPSIDDYYEPWTYNYEHLFDAPASDDQPVARPISQITGELVQIESGPNWDDDLGGSPVYAANDPNLEGLSEEQREQLSSVERLVYFYLPRICNHCLNPSCVASCPSGALYKRGQDGIVLVDQNRCRAWRSCVAACPYKKVYYNWFAGKAEKCILCYPRLETGQAPACFHSCVGRIRYLGVLLYDASRIEEVALKKDAELVEAHRSLILDPNDPEVISAARAAGIDEAVLESARKSPVFKFVKEWKMALPPHIEYRTMPMLFYVPPLSPVISSRVNGLVDFDSTEFFHDIDESRVPVRFLANLFGAGEEREVRYALRKQKAVRWWRRARTAGDVDQETALRMLAEADCTPEQAEAIYQLTSLCTFEDRFVIPPMHREQVIEQAQSPQQARSSAGFGFTTGTARSI